MPFLSRRRWFFSGNLFQVRRFKVGHSSFRRRFISSILFFIIFHSTYAQNSHRSTDQIEQDWKNYTSFQKNELLNFCDFLFDEGYYERTVLSCFRYIFLYPDDELIPLVYYRISRSYEESGISDLAIEYYQQVQSEVGSGSSEYRSALYRITHLHLQNGNYGKVHDIASGTNDPYLIVFDGYANISELNWVEAKESFLAARKRFRSDRYDRTLRRLIRACDGVSSISKRSGFYTGLFGIFPGGGRIYQQDWAAATGVLVSSIGLGIQLIGGSSSVISSGIPVIALAAIYGGSVLGSVRDVEYANQQLQKRYARGVKAKLGSRNFLDFPEPGHLSSD